MPPVTGMKSTPASFMAAGMLADQSREPLGVDRLGHGLPAGGVVGVVAGGVVAAVVGAAAGVAGLSAGFSTGFTAGWVAAEAGVRGVPVDGLLAAGTRSSSSGPETTPMARPTISPRPSRE